MRCRGFRRGRGPPATGGLAWSRPRSTRRAGWGSRRVCPVTLLPALSLTATLSMQSSCWSKAARCFGLRLSICAVTWPCSQTAIPTWASRLQDIRAVLDTSPPDATSPTPGLKGKPTQVTWHASDRQASVELRRRKAREWDNVLSEVRKLNGFEHFLSAIPYPELTAAAVGGHVAIVYASRYGSHALIVAPDVNQPLVIDLPDLTLSTVADRATQMMLALAGQADGTVRFQIGRRTRHTILDVLAWLWDALAEPVLTTLGYDTTPKAGAPWPRIWWCPIGPLTVLPIHAAGHHPRLR